QRLTRARFSIRAASILALIAHRDNLVHSAHPCPFLPVSRSRSTGGRHVLKGQAACFVPALLLSAIRSRRTGKRPDSSSYMTPTGGLSPPEPSVWGRSLPR